MWHRYVVLLAILTIAVAALRARAQPAPDQPQSAIFQVADKRNAKRYCGKYLADILSLVCKGKYYTKYHKKSYVDVDSAAAAEEDYDYEQHQYLDEPPRFPFRSKPNAAVLLPGAFRRYARGVHDECCAKPCSVNELVSYCAER